MSNGDELAYALITPYSLHKSRTGGILARLLWVNVELVAARMYAPRPDGEFIRRYCDAIYDAEARSIPLEYQKLLIGYVVENFARPNARDMSNRIALLIFRGQNARAQIAEAVGRLGQRVRGDDVRGTYGDYLPGRRDMLKWAPGFAGRYKLLERYERLCDVAVNEPYDSFFEPAALTGVTPEMNEAHLKLFRDCACTDGGLVMDALDVEPSALERTTVILKPESFRSRNPLPGNMIDFFSRSGMYIVAMKMLALSVEEAREFYSLKLPQFRRVLRGMVADRARLVLRRARLLAQQAVDRMGASRDEAFLPRNAVAAAEAAEALFCATPGPGDVKPAVVRRIYEELRNRLTDLDPTDAFFEKLADDLRDVNAAVEFDELIRYMTGRDPQTGKPLDDRHEARCMALTYAGPDALNVIRRRLKELREVYGMNVLVNRAHASDPDEDPAKEMDVLGMPGSARGESRPCDVERVVNAFYGDEGAA